jgi:hypothetical protein
LLAPRPEPAVAPILEHSGFSRIFSQTQAGMLMAKRWSAEDIDELKNLAQKYSVQAIAEKIDRTVGGVAFKAHQLGVPLKSRAQAAAPNYADFDWVSENRPVADEAPSG